MMTVYAARKVEKTRPRRHRRRDRGRTDGQASLAPRRPRGSTLTSPAGAAARWPVRPSPLTDLLDPEKAGKRSGDLPGATSGSRTLRRESVQPLTAW